MKELKQETSFSDILGGGGGGDHDHEALSTFKRKLKELFWCFIRWTYVLYANMYAGLANVYHGRPMVCDIWRYL